MTADTEITQPEGASGRWDCDPVEHARVVEALGRVRALADHWERMSHLDAFNDGVRFHLAERACDLRAALDGPETATGGPETALGGSGGSEVAGSEADPQIGAQAAVVHMAPTGDASSTPCCGVDFFELPRHERVTTMPKRVTCHGVVKNASGDVVGRLGPSIPNDPPAPSLDAFRVPLDCPDCGWLTPPRRLIVGALDDWDVGPDAMRCGAPAGTVDEASFSAAPPRYVLGHLRTCGCHCADVQTCPRCDGPASPAAIEGRWDAAGGHTARPFEAVWVRLSCGCEFGDSDEARP